MSYCRIGNHSDVYIYGSKYYLNCCGCSSNFVTGSYSEMLKHIKEHLKKGDKVPQYAIKRLISEREELGDIYPIQDNF